MPAFTPNNRGSHQFDRLNRYRLAAEINVTPLVDVMLVLLIIFMVTAPMLTSGLKLTLPQAKSAQSVDEKTPLIISVTREGRILIGADEVTRHEVGAVAKARNSDGSRTIHLRGDREAAFGVLVQVLDELVRHGLTRVTIRTERDETANPSSAVQ